MGHIPTIVVTCLASALTLLYFVLPDATHFAMMVFVAAAWFLAIICWLAQKSADYITKGGYGHEEKKKLVNNNSHQQTVQVSSNQIKQAKVALGAELDELRNTVKNKDSEIENLKNEIASLQTLVQIEALKTELANLKALAAKESSKRK